MITVVPTTGSRISLEWASTQITRVKYPEWKFKKRVWKICNIWSHSSDCSVLFVRKWLAPFSCTSFCFTEKGRYRTCLSIQFSACGVKMPVGIQMFATISSKDHLKSLQEDLQFLHNAKAYQAWRQSYKRYLHTYRYLLLYVGTGTMHGRYCTERR